MQPHRSKRSILLSIAFVEYDFYPSERAAILPLAKSDITVAQVTTKISATIELI